MLVHLYVVIAVVKMTTQSYNLLELCLSKAFGYFTNVINYLFNFYCVLNLAIYTFGKDLEAETTKHHWQRKKTEKGEKKVVTQ